MRVHAIVADAETARWAAAHGATAVQLRVKGVDTAARIRVAREIGPIAAMIVINDDVEAALAVGAAAVHLGQDDTGVERSRAARLAFGRSVATPREAREAEAEGALYLGAGPIWTTPSKPDAGPAIGLAGLAAICAAASIPVIAIGGVDATTAGACVDCGATGVAVVRGVADLDAIRRAVNAAATHSAVEQR